MNSACSVNFGATAPGGGVGDSLERALRFGRSIAGLGASEAGFGWFALRFELRRLSIWVVVGVGVRRGVRGWIRGFYASLRISTPVLIVRLTCVCLFLARYPAFSTNT